MPTFLMKTTETTMQNDSKELEQQESKSPKLSPEAELIDNAFWVEPTRFMWKSIRKDTGKDFLFAVNKEEVLKMTRWYLKCEQEGTLHLYSRVVNSGVVGGKL